MTDLEERVLDLALEELYGPGSADADAALRRLRQKLSEERAPEPAPKGIGRRAAALAASVLSIGLASWFVLGRVDPPPAPGGRTAAQEPPAEGDVKPWIDQLSDPDAAVRDRASAALKAKGPELVGRLREELNRASDPEVRSRLQDLITYWADAVAARVGPDLVTWDEVKALLKDLRPSEITEELRRQILRRLVEELVFLQESRRRGIVVTDAEIQEGVRRLVEGYGGEETHRAVLRARGLTPEGERDQLRRQVSIAKLYDRILEEARVNPGADPFKLDLSETSREELGRWYDANPDKFAAVDRVDLSWVEFPFKNEQERAARKTLADALVEKARAKNNLGLACAEMGVKENMQIRAFERGERLPGPFGEGTMKQVFDRFTLGEVRVVEDPPSTISVVQLYDRSRQVRETFAQAEPALRAMFENQKREANRKRMRDGLLQRAQITPRSLIEDR